MSPVCKVNEVEEELDTMLSVYHMINKFSEFYIAVLAGHYVTVRKMIKAGVDVNRLEPENKVTPIYAAIREEDVQMVEELIHAGANVNIRFPTFKATPLGIALWTENADIVNLLLDNGADFTKTLKDFSALHYCAASGKVKMAKLLMKRGLEIDICKKRKQTPLHTAVECGQPRIVQLLIARGANISATFSFTNKKEDEEKGWLNVTPLCLAAELGHCDIANMLIRAGADVNVRASGNFTPLHHAIKRGRFKLVEILLKAGAKVNVMLDFKSYTPLSYAALLGHIDIVEVLLKVEGIEIEAMPGAEETPLVFAAGNGHLEVVKVLLANGALVNGCTVTKATPLHVALRNKNDDVVEVLIANGADIHAADEKNLVPLHVACEKGVSVDVIKMLVEKGAKLDARTKDGATPLHLAAKFNEMKIVQFLLNCGADPSVSDEKNCTPLDYALSNECVEAAIALLRKLPDPNTVMYFLSLLLHITVEKRSIEYVKLMLISEAKINMQDNYGHGCTPLHFSLTDERVEIAELLLKRDALFVDLKEPRKGRTLLFCAVERNQEKLVRLLLDEGADVNAANKDGVLPIHVAAKLENVNIVRALLDKGAYYNIIVNSKRYSGAPLCFARKANNSKLIIIFKMVTKLFKAVIKNNVAQIERCIQAGASVNARKRSGRTALHFAVSQDNADAVKVLLSGGADITLESNKGDLPLQIALANGCIQISEILLAHAKNLGCVMYNSVIDAKTVEGCTVLHTAAESNRLEVVKFLLKNGAVYNVKNNSGKTPRDLTTDDAIKSLLVSAEKLFEAVKKEDGLEEVKQILEDNNCLVNARDEYIGDTSLLWAILEGHTDIAQTLISNGADIRLVRNDGINLVYTAAHVGNTKILDVLIRRMKSDNAEKLNDYINAKATDGRVALHLAANSEVVKYLLKAGAMYDIRDNQDMTALQFTPNNGIRMLLEKVEEVFENVKEGVMDKLNDLGTDDFETVTSTRNARGQSLVQVALVNSHPEIASLLLKKLK